MVDIKKRIVVFGDGNLRVSFNSFGMCFENTDNQTDQCKLNLLIDAINIIDFYKKLSDMEEKGELERTFNATTMKFMCKEDILRLKESLLIFGTFLKKNADIMADFVNEKIKEEYPDTDFESILKELEMEDVCQNQEK